jgi:hypothetical protein
MSKLDFKALVESLLFESIEDFKRLFQDKLNVTDADFNRIYTLLASGDRYIPGERWEPSLEATPVLDVVVKALGNSYRAAKNLLTAKKIASIEQFYDVVYQSLQALPNKEEVLRDILPIDQGFDFQKLNADVRTTYDKALKHRTGNVLVQNVWPTINQETIIDSIVKILETRLTGLERVKISVNLLKNYIVTGGRGTNTTLTRPNFKTLTETFLKDLFSNTVEYSKGNKKANPDIVNVLNNINISYEDLLKIATYTRQLYEALLFTEYPDAEENEKKKAAVEASLAAVNDNSFILAKNGMFVYTLPNAKIAIRPTGGQGDYYTLNYIEKLNLDPGKEIIKIIKDISSGIRVKQPGAGKIIGKAAGALGALRTGMGPVG